MVINPLLDRKISLYFSIGIAVLAFLQTLAVFYFYLIPPLAALTDALVSWIILGVFVFFVINTFSFYQPLKWRAFVVVFGAAVFSYFWITVSELLIRLMTRSDELMHFFDNTYIYRLTVAFLLFIGAICFGLVWYRLGEKQDEQRRNEETERMSREAELFKLRQQLQPHFLFNSLNSINSLIGSRPQEARSMVQQLSEFLRGTLRREDQKLVSLKEELDYLKLYLDIEQVRFGHRLKVDMDMEEGCLNWKIPPLILQPILENAIKFGLYGTTENLVIVLKCRAANNHLLLSISNPFDPDMQAPAGTGFGLKSVNRRLYLLFARTDLLETRVADDHFTVNLKIPRLYDQGIDN